MDPFAVPPRPDLPPSPLATSWSSSPPPQQSTTRRLLALVVVGALLVSSAVAFTAGRATKAHPGYAFLGMHGSQPDRWNPCQPIHYVVNDRGAPAGALGDVQQGFTILSNATGIAFVYDGPTDERPALFRQPFQPDRYGERWAPVLISWSDPADQEIPWGRDPQEVLGFGLPISPDPQHPEVFVSAEVTLNSQQREPEGFSAPNELGLVLLHEFGHMMGLAHVRQPGELMQPDGGGMTHYGPGDLEGLRELGLQGGCAETPSVP